LIQPSKVWRQSLLLSSFLFLFTSFSLAEGALDGTYWKLDQKLGKKRDILKFEEGQFTSSQCLRFGFETTPYASKTLGKKTVSWNATLKSSRGEKMIWKGTRSGTSMRGSYTFVKGNGRRANTTWSAQKIPPPS